MYSKLVEQIKELLKNQKIVVVAISGHGGSGKSTLADRLAKEFDINQDQLVRIDGFHAKNYMQAKNIYAQHDWDALISLLNDIRSTERMKYLSRDWKGAESLVDVSRPQVLIIEGIRLIRPELLPYFDVSVWIDCPLELATERAVVRNKQQGDSKEEINLWYTKWVPEAQYYIEDAQPQSIADFVYTEYGPKS